MLLIFLIYRDLGEHLREFVKRETQTNSIEDSAHYWDCQYLSLQRLLQNEHKNNYPRFLTSTGTGLTLEQCKYATSNDFMKELEGKSTLFTKIAKFFTREE